MSGMAFNAAESMLVAITSHHQVRQTSKFSNFQVLSFLDIQTVESSFQTVNPSTLQPVKYSNLQRFIYQPFTLSNFQTFRTSSLQCPIFSKFLTSNFPKISKHVYQLPLTSPTLQIPMFFKPSFFHVSPPFQPP